MKMIDRNDGSLHYILSAAKAMASHTAATPTSDAPFYSQGLGNCSSTTDCEPCLEIKSKGLYRKHVLQRRQELGKEQFHKLPTAEAVKDNTY